MKKYALPIVVAMAVAGLAAACSDGPLEPGSTHDSHSPASLTRQSADGQSATAGTSVTGAPAVLVKDARGLPLIGVRVQFVVTQGGGSVEQAAAITNEQGTATAVAWTLGSEPGPNEVEARVGMVPPVRFSATGIARGPAPPPPAPVPTTGAYQIAARYLVTASLRQQQAVSSAIGRWQNVITSDLQDIPVSAAASDCFAGQPALNEVTDDILIFIEFVNIDGAGKTLGEAGPCYVRADNRLPIVGHLRLDVADLQQMEANGALDDVVLHEIGHVLGIGTLWPDKNLIVGSGGADPGFTGASALSVYRALGGPAPSVPVENTGAVGTRDGHWRESVFGNELMTGWIGRAPNPLSELTIASLQDLGYGANPGAASAYALSGVSQLSGVRLDLQGREHIRRPKWKIDRRGRRSPHQPGATAR